MPHIGLGSIIRNFQTGEESATYFKEKGEGYNKGQRISYKIRIEGNKYMKARVETQTSDRYTRK